MGVVVRRYIDILTIIINFPYSTCISSFFSRSIPTSFFIFKCFFGLVSVIILQYIANVTQRTFEIIQKYQDPANIIASEASLLHELAGAFLWYIYIYICIHGQTICNPVTRNAQTSDRPVEFQWSI